MTGAISALRRTVTENWRPAGKRAGAVGLGVGMVAVGAAAGAAAQHLTGGYTTRRRARDELDAAAPFGALRGRPHTVYADDGTELYAEVDPADAPPAEASPATPEAAPASDPTGGAPLTVVFCHGYTLNQDAWHFQRAALRGAVRMVFFDQRSHGRSGRGTVGAAGFLPLARDLRAVLDELAADGPVVLVGHSMGGMTVLAFAAEYPELFRRRVAGVALCSSTAGQWATSPLGLPAPAGRLVHRTAPGLLRTLGRQAGLAEWGRRRSADVIAPFVKRYSFASGVDPVVARFAERMIEATPLDVIAEFLPSFYAHDTAGALPLLDTVETLLVHGDSDLLVPPEHAAAIATAVPQARLALVHRAGHLVLLEHPELVTGHIAALLARVAARLGRVVPPGLEELAQPRPRTAAESGADAATQENGTDD